jgi:hypothetical protein
VGGASSSTGAHLLITEDFSEHGVLGRDRNPELDRKEAMLIARTRT